MVLIALAACLVQSGAGLSDWGRLEFEVVASDAEGLYSVPFSESDRRYVLMRSEADGIWSRQTRLGAADSFSPFQSRQSLSLPPGRYAIVERGGSDGALEVPGTAAARRLLTFRLGQGDWIKISCSAHGPPVCAAERQNGFSAFQ